MTLSTNSIIINDEVYMKHLIIFVTMFLLIHCLLPAQNSLIGTKQDKPLGALLKSDGTINLKSGFKGSLDLKGYKMTTGPNGMPKFIPSSTEASLVNPDDYWDSTFSLPGTDGPHNCPCG